MQDSAQLYIEHGIMTGGFLTAVMENDLVEAFARADSINTEWMREWAFFLYNAPGECWGSPEKVKAWKVRGGLQGHEAQAER